MGIAFGIFKCEQRLVIVHIFKFRLLETLDYFYSIRYISFRIQEYRELSKFHVFYNIIYSWFKHKEKKVKICSDQYMILPDSVCLLIYICSFKLHDLIIEIVWYLTIEK